MCPSPLATLLLRLQVSGGAHFHRGLDSHERVEAVLWNPAESCVIQVRFSAGPLGSSLLYS